MIKFPIYLVLIGSLYFGCASNSSNIIEARLLEGNAEQVPGIGWVYKAKVSPLPGYEVPVDSLFRFSGTRDQVKNKARELRGGNLLRIDNDPSKSSSGERGLSVNQIQETVSGKD
ncbi:hypothetical protein ACFLZJ_01465 [Nanoarchaeota archaeon]